MRAMFEPVTMTFGIGLSLASWASRKGDTGNVKATAMTLRLGRIRFTICSPFVVTHESHVVCTTRWLQSSNTKLLDQ
jgi:hypothetical protein